ncbi:MAG: hypothetical protein IT348_19860 [Candidatus Eisenbacteria bacterium]|nr:hypothetical protein [Candidatus Eisenbacteria bacterium]
MKRGECPDQAFLPVDGRIVLAPLLTLPIQVITLAHFLGLPAQRPHEIGAHEPRDLVANLARLGGGERGECRWE